MKQLAVFIFSYKSCSSKHKQAVSMVMKQGLLDLHSVLKFHLIPHLRVDTITLLSIGTSTAVSRFKHPKWKCSCFRKKSHEYFVGSYIYYFIWHDSHCHIYKGGIVNTWSMSIISVTPEMTTSKIEVSLQKRQDKSKSRPIIPIKDWQ